MRFTPAQAIALADISAETLRYWKKSVPTLASKRGQAPCYTRAEIVGLIVLRQLVREFKMDVSALTTQSETLFGLCTAQWARPIRRLIRVTSHGHVTAHENLTGIEFSEAAIVFPLNIAIEELEARLNEHESQPQMELSLPPVQVNTRVRSAL